MSWCSGGHPLKPWILAITSVSPDGNMERDPGNAARRASWGCFNKSPPTKGLKTTETHSLMFLSQESETSTAGLKSRCWQGHTLFLVFPSFWWLLAFLGL